MKTAKIQETDPLPLPGLPQVRPRSAREWARYEVESRNLPPGVYVIEVREKTPFSDWEPVTDLQTGSNKLVLHLSDQDDAGSYERALRRVWVFFLSHFSKARRFEVLCPLGLSRSTAVSAGLLFLITGKESWALHEILHHNENAQPNIDILEVWDRILGSQLTRTYLQSLCRWKPSTNELQRPYSPQFLCP